MELNNLIELLKKILKILFIFDYGPFINKVQIGGNNNSNEEQEEEEEEESLSDTIKKNFEQVLNVFFYIVSVFIFASLYPALPFFGVLAGLLSIIKYFIFNTRKL